MLTPGNVVKVYKKEVLDNLVSGWNKVCLLYTSDAADEL